MHARHAAASLCLVGSLFAVGACTVESSEDPAVASDSDALTAGCKKASDCHGALPDLCEQCGGGVSACAHWECKSHKCVDTICPVPAPECTTASDCHGALPDICEQCSGGGSACAHWACESHKCVDKICN
jgi:hypothetical protein